MEKSNNKKIGYVMAIAGFLLIVANALQYIFSNNATFVPALTIGLALVVVGTIWIRKNT
jgi:hypothetical protein